jgi:hypothetical protein
MQEFKINADAANRSRRLRTRIASWETVLLCFLVSVLIFVLHVNGFLETDPVFEGIL